MKPLALALALRTTAIPLHPTTAQASKSPPADSPSNSRTSKTNKAPPTTTKTTPQPATTRAVQKNTSTTIIISNTILTSLNLNQPGPTVAVEAGTASPAPTTTSATPKINNPLIPREVCGMRKRSESYGDTTRSRFAVDCNSGYYLTLSLSCGSYIPSIRHSFWNV